MRSTFTNILLFLFAFSYNSEAQNLVNNYGSNLFKRTPIPNNLSLDGQWRGTFTEDENGNAIPQDSIVYVLELKFDDSNISGSSYTYFYEGATRYYTICRVIGNLSRSNNSIVVTEVERTGHNTPPWWSNCLQTHRLYFEKGRGNTEYLKGDWVPAPGQHCLAVGSSVLSKHRMNRTPLAVKPPSRKPSIAQNRRPATTPRNKPATQTPKKAETNLIAKAEPPKTRIETTKIPVEGLRTKTPSTPNVSKITSGRSIDTKRGYKKRKNVVVQNIALENKVFQVDFYDNGVIDGDSISVFYNDNLVLSDQMLTDKPLTLTLSLGGNQPTNTITMYAENLGSIPPNTALMIVRDGNKRYEVRMESDMGKSSSVTFSHK